MSLSWDSDNMEVMKGDCLSLLKKIFIDLPYYRPMRIYTVICLIVHVPLWSIQYYHFLKEGDTKLFVQYGPASLILLYGYISSLIPLWIKDLIYLYHSQMKSLFWSLRSGSPSTYQKSIKLATFVTYSAKTSLALAALCYICIILRHRANKEWEIFYQVTYIKKHFPNQAHIMIFIFYATLLCFILPMMSTFYVLTYFTIHTYFQAGIVLDRIEKITENIPLTTEAIDDSSYQRQIFHRLRFCIKRYGVMKEYITNALKRVKYLIVFYMLLAFMLILSYAGTMYLDPDKYYPLTIISCILCAQLGLLVAEIGQLMEDTSKRLYDEVISSSWYTFNVKNRKMFLLFIILSSKPITMCPFETFPMNRKLIVQFYKVFASISTVIANTALKK